VLGGTHPDAGAAILKETAIRYCPFPGTVEGHPSVLSGGHDQIVEHARRLSATEGVHGVDLLAHRHESLDPVALTRAVVEAVDGPVIVAGSIASLGQIAALGDAGAWGFTIGGAIFEGRLPGGPTVAGQVAAVLDAARGKAEAVCAESPPPPLRTPRSRARAAPSSAPRRAQRRWQPPVSGSSTCSWSAAA
jgi:hypothetical protein